MSEESILTLHPQGKSGRNISKSKYDTMKAAITSVLHDQRLTQNQLMARVELKLRGTFEGNISWYAETVKLDLEARNVIKRTSDQPQKYYLAN
ncbi:MAG TPA: hypothetical protein VLE72_03000 [Candidatus Saccharimonadales bacterium]|nr:hypothetical protein [Candidatus Saccharimonadales bacterium]